MALKAKKPAEKLEWCMALEWKKISVLGLAGFGPEDAKTVPYGFSCTYTWLSLNGQPETYGIKSHGIYVFVVLFQISTSRADPSVDPACHPNTPHLSQPVPGKGCCPAPCRNLQFLLHFFEIPYEPSRKFGPNLFSWREDIGKVRGRPHWKFFFKSVHVSVFVFIFVFNKCT